VNAPVHTPLVVGVAGKCCAGKDEVTRWLESRGWQEINVDRIGHEALEAKRERILAAFGDGIRAADGTIDRRALGSLVFGDATRRHTLEAIVHPWMRERVGEIVERPNRHRGLVINAALLFPMHLAQLCDLVLLVKAPLLERLRRAYRRDGLSVRRILRRLWAQRSLDAQAYRSPADIITVENGQTREVLYQRLASLEAFHDG
jgi:dephospho-CoA kinase